MPLKPDLKITKFDKYNLLRIQIMTNQNFSNGYGYFDNICIFAGNTIHICW